MEHNEIEQANGTTDSRSGYVSSSSASDKNTEDNQGSDKDVTATTTNNITTTKNPPQQPQPKHTSDSLLANREVRSQNPQNESTQSRRRRKRFAVSTQWERSVADNSAPKDCSSYFCCCAERIGNMHGLLMHPDGSPLVIAGPCWPFCMFVTLPLILVIAGLVAYFFIIRDTFELPKWLLIIYCPSVVVVLCLLFCVSCQDPGLMERVTDEEAGEGGWFWNEQVSSFRPPGALYCREAGVLILEYDHLCPWTGTGIGRGNMLAFKSFVVSVNILCYMSIGIVIWGLLDGLGVS